MLDFDLAALYEVETSALKQSVKRNLIRSPEGFMFQLTKNEWTEVITNCDNLPRNIKFSPSTPLRLYGTRCGYVIEHIEQ
jgi:hypothetical protein